MSMTSARYRNYLLTTLTALYLFNFMELTALGMALQSIKTSLHLSDAQLGLVSGVAFSLFYSIVGIPMGRWADRGNRVTLLAVTRALWGVLVILTGRVTSFLQLFLVRMGVAAGESGCLPAGYSFIGDYYSKEERPQALGVFFLGAPLSLLFGYFVSGWLLQYYGWRTMFTILGIPGFVLALIAWLTLKEPRSRRHGKMESSTKDEVNRVGADAPQPGSKPPSVRTVIRSLVGNVTYRNLLISFTIGYFFVAGASQFQAAFFLRSYGLKSSVLGMWLAVAYGLSGVVGNVAGGRIATGVWAGNERWQLIAVAILYGVNGVMLPMVYLTRDYHLAFALIGLTTLAAALANAPFFGALQAVVPARMRATSLVIVYLFSNLIGTGLGPFVTGWISDALHPVFGVNSLRYALLFTTPWVFLGGWYLWRASRTVERDMLVARNLEETGSGAEGLLAGAIDKL